MKQKLFLILCTIVLSLSFLFPGPVQEPAVQVSAVQEPPVEESPVEEPAGEILCFGDSITHARGHGWVEMIGEKQGGVTMINAGRSGRKTGDKDELAVPLSNNSDAGWVLFFLGVNDLRDGTPEMVASCVEGVWVESLIHIRPVSDPVKTTAWAHTSPQIGRAIPVPWVRRFRCVATPGGWRIVESKAREKVFPEIGKAILRSGY